MDSLIAPTVLQYPSLDLTERHEGNQWDAAGEFRVVSGAKRVILEHVGDDVCIDADTGHSKGSVRLCPRHSRIVATNSSTDSSSGQKSPWSTDTSVIGPVPCSTINCSTEGCPEAAKGTVAGRLSGWPSR